MIIWVVKIFFVQFFCVFLPPLMTNLDSIFKSRDITLLTKVRLVKAMVYPVKKAEHQRIDAFEHVREDS